MIMVEGKGIGMGKVFLLLSCVAHVLRPRVRVVFWLFFLGEFFFSSRWIFCGIDSSFEVSCFDCVSGRPIGFGRGWWRHLWLEWERWIFMMERKPRLRRRHPVPHSMAWPIGFRAAVSTTTTITTTTLTTTPTPTKRPPEAASTKKRLPSSDGHRSPPKSGTVRSKHVGTNRTHLERHRITEREREREREREGEKQKRTFFRPR